jgi:hypothetical protein
MTAFRVYTADEAGALLRPSMRHVSWHVVQRDGGRAVCTVVGDFIVCIPTIATDADLLAAAPGLVNTVRVLTTERDTARADAQAATAQLDTIRRLLNRVFGWPPDETINYAISYIENAVGKLRVEAAMAERGQAYLNALKAGDDPHVATTQQLQRVETNPRAQEELRAAQAEIAALRAENARLTRLPWSLELAQDYTAAQAQALLDAFPPPLPAGPQCPECKAWYDDHGSRWPHAPGCSELTRYDRHDAAVWELRDAAYGLARALIRTEAERDAARADYDTLSADMAAAQRDLESVSKQLSSATAEAARLAGVRSSDDVPRHLRIALAHATRAFETGNFGALATINEDIQQLADAALGAVRREQVKVERLEREIWDMTQATTSCPPVEGVHVRDEEPVTGVVEVHGER